MVKVYLDITGEWCVNTPDQKISWSRQTIGDDIQTLRRGATNSRCFSGSATM